MKDYAFRLGLIIRIAFYFFNIVTKLTFVKLFISITIIYYGPLHYLYTKNAFPVIFKKKSIYLFSLRNDVLSTKRSKCTSKKVYNDLGVTKRLFHLVNKIERE